MFKKGQLVQSVKYGFKYIVCSDEIHGCYVCIRTHAGVHGTIEAQDIRLIGNNYKPKLTDKK